MRSPCVAAVSLGVLTAVSPLPAAAGKAEWPHRRGPNRDAVSADTRLLKEWPADGPPLAWRAEGLGCGYSGVVYQKGQVALIEARPDGCKLKGLFELPRQGGPAWAHPVVCGGKLYLRWADKLFCYDVKAR